jgi:hypothetical protein
MRRIPVVLVVLCLGCDAAAPTTAVVRGRVTYRGAPLPTGSIVFVPDPDRGGSGPMSRGDVGADGTYRLRVCGDGGGEGAAVGWHRVTIHAVEVARTATVGDLGPAPRSLLPDHYRDPELSGLRREVRAGAENVIDFDLP